MSEMNLDSLLDRLAASREPTHHDYERQRIHTLKNIALVKRLWARGEDSDAETALRAIDGIETILDQSVADDPAMISQLIGATMSPLYQAAREGMQSLLDIGVVRSVALGVDVNTYIAEIDDEFAAMMPDEPVEERPLNGGEE